MYMYILYSKGKQYFSSLLKLSRLKRQWNGSQLKTIAK